ncbi:hypothetical protein [Rhizobium sp. RCC_161_2]|uniref:hypothetical protein n=1 Tax=Rhizobium sp. RCC_161_2 TaxID=3239219 RepID=UPI003523954E
MAKGPPCTVCQNRERAAIDLALARKVPFAALARRYKLGSDSLRRHEKNHLPPQLRAQLLAGPADLPMDLDRLKETESQSLLANIVALRHRLFAMMDRAEEVQDTAGAQRAASQLHRNFELTGKLLGDLSTGTTINNNVLISPAYIEMRSELVRALKAHPDAARAVAAVLQGLETRFAEGMTIDHGYASGPAAPLSIASSSSRASEEES